MLGFYFGAAHSGL